MKSEKLAVIAVIAVLFFMAQPVRTSARTLPVELPPIAKTLPPMAVGCYEYPNSKIGWVAIGCGDSRPLQVPSEGGNFGVYGEKLTGATISNGEVYISFSQFSGESDSNDGSNAWSLQANTNYFTGNNGQTDWVQFTEQNNLPCFFCKFSRVCVWNIDVTTQNYTPSCVNIDTQTLSSSYTSYVVGFSSNGQVTSEFCSYQQNKCWSASANDEYGLSGKWNTLSGTNLGAGGGSNAGLTSPTNMQTQISFTGLTSSIEKDYLTGETNNLNYYAESHYCLRALCYVAASSSN